MNNYSPMVRGIIVNGDKDGAVANVKRVKVYPLSESGNPRANKFVSMSGKVMDTTPKRGMHSGFSAVIKTTRGGARPGIPGDDQALGIEKGKTLQPDAPQRNLEEAAKMGERWGR